MEWNLMLCVMFRGVVWCCVVWYDLIWCNVWKKQLNETASEGQNEWVSYTYEEHDKRRYSDLLENLFLHMLTACHSLWDRLWPSLSPSLQVRQWPLDVLIPSSHYVSSHILVLPMNKYDQGTHWAMGKTSLIISTYTCNNTKFWWLKSTFLCRHTHIKHKKISVYITSSSWLSINYGK